MSDTNRYLITRIKRRNTLNGKPVVDLFAGGKDSKLRFPVLTLFDLSELVVVGIDPNELREGQEVNCRFWAYYTESDKRNKDGNPYRDVDHLEALAAPAGGESANVDAVMEAMDRVYDELGEVKGELATLRQEIDAVFNLLTAQFVQPPPAPVVEQPAPVTPASPTDFWKLARSLPGVDDATKKRLAAEAAKSGDWAGAIARLRAS